jgi:hypothetical protein
MARKMLQNLHCLQNAERVMRHENIKAPNPHHQAELLGALDQLSEIAIAIDLASLAVIGMAEELGSKDGYLLANHLRDQADLIRKTERTAFANLELPA